MGEIEKKETNRAFRGVWIPKELWLCKDITKTEMLFLAEIDSLDGEHGCFASNSYFAEFMGMSTRRVQEIISSLCKKKYIKSTLIYKKNSKEIDKRILKIYIPPFPYIPHAEIRTTPLRETS